MTVRTRKTYLFFQRYRLLLILVFAAYLFLMYHTLKKNNHAADNHNAGYTESYIDQSHELTDENGRLQFQRNLVLQIMKKQIKLEKKIPPTQEKENSSNYNIPQSVTTVAKIMQPAYLITCANINKIVIKSFIGNGVSKQAYKDDFNGIPVVVKIVTYKQSDVSRCLTLIKDNSQNRKELISRCYVFATRKLMKEILVSEQLNHHGLAQLLGYCIRHENNEGQTTMDLSMHGIVSVFELSPQGIMTKQYMAGLPWQRKIKHAMEITDILTYFENSPLGSLIVRDCKWSHFLRFNNSLKLIDLDDIDTLEPLCTPSSPSLNKNCDFNLTCVNDVCKGYNAKKNMNLVSTRVLKPLLSARDMPTSVSSNVQKWLSLADTGGITAIAMQMKLQGLLDMYSNNLTFTANI